MVNYQYDSQNRLISVGDTSYTYDAANNRIAKSENGVITRYVVNPNAALSQLLMETDENGAAQAYYIYGIGLVGKIDVNGNKYYSYHFDNRGNTVALTDETGEVTDRYSYEPYGEIIQKFGETENCFLYVGQYGVMAENNGLYYMRARYYNPEIKAFINEDTVIGNVADTLSLNRYAYVKGNPLSYVDPSGHEGININDNIEVETKIVTDLEAWLEIAKIGAKMGLDIIEIALIVKAVTATGVLTAGIGGAAVAIAFAEEFIRAGVEVSYGLTLLVSAIAYTIINGGFIITTYKIKDKPKIIDYLLSFTTVGPIPKPSEEDSNLIIK